MRARSSRAAKAHEFSQKSRKEIFMRDLGQCIFCRLKYHEEEATWLGKEMQSVMHYIPRSRGGLGIPENGAIGCAYHHDMLDNGYRGRREEMLQIFKNYLQSKYPNWDEMTLTYNKWRQGG